MSSPTASRLIGGLEKSGFLEYVLTTISWKQHFGIHYSHQTVCK